MGLRGVVRDQSTNTFDRVARQVTDLITDHKKLRSLVRRECFKVKGYEMVYRSAGSGGPGVYLVNQRDGDPNFGTETFVGP